jgi:hypothetical protein
MHIVQELMNNDRLVIEILINQNNLFFRTIKVHYQDHA